ncbi:MAG: hypothetical protein J6A18_06880 [Alistipes sp.]|nr:hypothetical protein [Alistipes sp.]
MQRSVTIKLLQTLQRGCSSLGVQARELIVGFLLSQRTERGAYVNKQGEEDLYYTVFGWLLESALGLRQDAEAMERYLAEVDLESLDLVHYAAAVRCRLLQRGAKGRLSLLWQALQRTPTRELESFRSVPNNDREAPYTQFIWMSLCEDTRNDYQPAALDAYRTSDGGYANVKGGKEMATNATAAALMVVGQSEGYDAARVSPLLEAQEPSGGFRATSVAPIPDLLSTATALFVLNCYGVRPRYEAADFVEAHWLESGGFAATLLDEKSDVEYLFYGLLALGTL